MFDEILGLPAHPLIIHATVVLTPLLAVLAAVYALLPRARTALTWAVTALAVIVPITVFVARQSGEELKEKRFSSVDTALARSIAEHEALATPLLLAAIALGLLSLALVHALRGGRLPRPVEVALSGLTVILAVVVGYYVLRSGHTGATAVWGI